MPEFQPIKVFLGHTGTIHGGAVSPDGRFAVSTCQDGFIRFWELAGENPLCIRTIPLGARAFDLSFSPDGRYLIWCQSGKAVTCNLERGSIYEYSSEGSTVYSAVFTPDSLYVLSPGKYDRQINRINFYLWGKPGSRVYRRSAWGRQIEIGAIAVSPDGKFAVTAGFSPQMEIWKLNLRKPGLHAVKRFSGHDKAVMDVAISPDSRQFLTCSADATLKLWQLSGGRPLKTLEGHTDVVNAAVFLPDGRRVLSASRDGSVRLWDMAAGSTILQLDAHPGGVNTLALTPDGRSLLTGGEDERLCLWDLEEISARAAS